MYMLLIIAGVFGLGLLTFISFRKNFPKYDDTHEPQLLPLYDVSKIWRPAPKSPVPPLIQEPVDIPEFSHPEIAEFSDAVLSKYPFMNKEVTVILRILELLDRFGDCPSVVKSGSSYGTAPDRYHLLARVPLWRHCISVARHMIANLEYDIVAPICIIIGLGHDIGKVPEFRGAMYCTGDHPLLSSVFLSGIPEFQMISVHSEILKVIQLHHFNAHDGLYSRLLRESDEAVRSLEHAEQLVANTLEGKENIPVKTEMPSLRKKDFAALLGLELEKTDLKDYSPCRIDISSWFHAKDFFDQLRACLNVVSSGRWLAVSMPNGLIYCGSSGLWKILCRAHPHTAPLLAAYANRRARFDIIYSVVLELSEQFDLLATELIAPNDFMCPVSIISGTGKQVKGSESPIRLIPFRAQVLGLDTFELEREKSLSIRSMANVITPVQAAHGNNEDADLAN